ncbi:MAG: hypothetical protein ABH856_03270 [Patescibacteria group bacterium]|nr:hypothetical protein [Patescibacteria group bacterium]
MTDEITRNQPETKSGPGSRAMFVVVLALVLIVGGIYALAQTPAVEEDNNAIVIDGKPVETIILEDIAGKDSDGKAVRYENDEGFVYELVASLPELADGHHFRGFLMQTPNLYVDMGKLEVQSAPVYTLKFVSETDYDDYLRVVVALQPDDVEKPDLRILEGFFEE